MFKIHTSLKIMESNYTHQSPQFAHSSNYFHQPPETIVPLNMYMLPIYAHPHPTTSFFDKFQTSAPGTASTWRQIGSIEYDLSKKLGGADKTIVYKGFVLEPPIQMIVNRKSAAIKRIFCGEKEEYLKNLKEVEVLRAIDDHQNIVKHLRTETVIWSWPNLNDHFYILIATELCSGHLQDWMQDKISGIRFSDADAVDLLQQTTKGVACLHGEPNFIIHGDLKPENILLKRVGTKVIVKIADFGISRELPGGRSSITTTTASGTKGWKSAEILNAPAPFRMSTATDIFALGCVFYYVLSGGKHPFDEAAEHPHPDYRDINIRRDRKNLRFAHFSDFSPRIGGYMELFERMIDQNPRKRPTAEKILSSPLFWGYQKELNFITHISNLRGNFPKVLLIRLQNEHCEIEMTFLRYIRNFSWMYRNCRELVTYFQEESPRRYNGLKIRDLLRAIRNMSGHYETLSFPVKAVLGPPPDEFMAYWDTKFPFLVPTCWNICKELTHLHGFESINIFYKNE